MVERGEGEPFALCDAFGDEFASESDLGQRDSALAKLALAVVSGGAVDADGVADLGVEAFEDVPVLTAVAFFAERAVCVLDEVGGVGVRDARAASAERVAVAMIERDGDERVCPLWRGCVGGAEGARDDHRE